MFTLLQKLQETRHAGILSLSIDHNDLIANKTIDCLQRIIRKKQKPTGKTFPLSEITDLISLFSVLRDTELS